MEIVKLFKKILFAILVIIPCGFAVVYMLNFAITNGPPRKMASEYEATEYALTLDNIDIRLVVCDETTLVGWLKNEGVIINIRVEYQNYGTAYEHHTAKIYNVDTNELIDYVKIECDGKKIKLTSKTESLDFYDPPNILDNIKTEDSIFSYLHSYHIILKAIT